MNRLVVSSRTRHDIHLPKPIGIYELTVAQPSLFAPDGSFHKAKVKQILQGN